MTDLGIESLVLQIAFKSIKNFALSPRRQERSAASLCHCQFLHSE